MSQTECGQLWVSLSALFHHITLPCDAGVTGAGCGVPWKGRKAQRGKEKDRKVQESQGGKKAKRGGKRKNNKVRRGIEKVREEQVKTGRYRKVSKER